MNASNLTLTLTDENNNVIDKWNTMLTRVYHKDEENGELVMFDEAVFLAFFKVVPPTVKIQIEDAMLMAVGSDI